MGRSPCCEKAHTNKGAWTKEEDERLVAYIRAHGGRLLALLPKAAGLLRCGKSCRLRWINYLRPDLKRGNFTADEDDLIIKLHGLLGNKWSLIAARLPGRTDNEIKNYWNTHVRKKLLNIGIDPVTHRPIQPQQEPPPRCPDLNLDLTISPPSPFQERDTKPVMKRELLQAGSRGGLCFGCILGLEGAIECSCGNNHFLGLRVGMLDLRSLEMK